jgi:putative transcriptional regulator
MRGTEGLTPLEQDMVRDLSELCDAIEADEQIEKRFTVRTISLDLHPKPYGPEDVRHIRHMLNASQALLAQFLGVSVKTVRAWEQGTRKIPRIACRYMDDIAAYPELWKKRLRRAVTQKPTT